MPPAELAPSDTLNQAPTGYYEEASGGKPLAALTSREVLRAMLACVDDATKNVTEAVQRRGAWERTLMLWTSDNGGQAGRGDGPNAASNRPWRGGKANLFEGGVRVLAFLSGGLLPPTAPRQLHNIVHICDWCACTACAPILLLKPYRLSTLLIPRPCPITPAPLHPSPPSPTPPSSPPGTPPLRPSRASAALRA